MTTGRRRVRWALALLLAGCASAPEGAPPVSPAASVALARVRDLRRHGAGPTDAALWDALAQARALAPDWTAPERLADDLLRAGLRGLEALEARREAVLLRPDDAGARYLLGRLEGAAGAEQFERALRLDPGLAWAIHGRAFEVARAGRPLLAARVEEAAVARARDPWERAWFCLSRARWLLQGERPARGMKLLRDALEDPDLPRSDLEWLAYETARLELAQPRLEEVRTGFRRGVELLREADLGDGELSALVGAMFDGPLGVEGRDELELAIGARSSPLRERLRAWLLLSRSARGLGRALLADSVEGASGRWRSLSRLQSFRMGDCAPAVLEWAADLPAQALDGEGRPSEPRLAALVAAARAWGEASDELRPGLAGSLGSALLAAGWFDEAREFAEHLAPSDAAGALDLNDRAVAGCVLLDALEVALTGEALGGESEDAPPVVLAPARAPHSAPNGSLDAILVGLAGAFAQAHERLGGETDAARVAESLAATPRLEYGALATLVHPGPRFSDGDERAGRGVAGAPVGGLAGEMAAIGRFALLGEFLGGGGPDATLLRVAAVCERAGEHLGAPWSGTVVWCDGVDVPGRAARGGARIAGAALHEGYWIDLAVVRRGVDAWARLARRFGRREGRAELGELLAVRGLRLRSDPGSRARSRERRAATGLMREASRVRLSVMRERAAGAALSAPSLTELARVVAVHEEGHLCDRERFLPLGRNLGRILGLLLRGGLTPRALQRRLELRAELVALCSVEDPRLPLADVLAAAEGGVYGPLPHGEAYRELLADFLRELDERRERDPAAWSALDPSRTLVHQLHHLGPEAVRTIALALARREGLVDE
ncbi:MAG: hypothetical protein QGI46_07130 [Planctomycetota bacterium]|nr:hypothetical protein [Planctomycetota bacterium]